MFAQRPERQVKSTMVPHREHTVHKLTKQKEYSHAVSQDVSFPLEAVCEAAAAELARETLLCAARSRAAVGAAGWRSKDLWETDFK